MLEVKNLSKQYDGNYVLKNVNLSIRDGEVYGLIGANGSGKSTFMNILNGKTSIVTTGGYEGSILINNEEVQIGNHMQSVSHGIAMVHQELALFKGMTVTENIKINRENVTNNGFLLPELAHLDKRKNREDAEHTLERIGANLDPDQKIEQLSLDQKQFVELARELDNQNVKLLMLDEPTSSLNITETRMLLKCIREIAASGISVLFISHRLDEIMEVCDTVSILRDGSLISTYERNEFDVNRFAEDMVGKEIIKANRREKNRTNDIVFQYKNIGRTNSELSVRKGEIIGITGLAGQGQDQFLDGLFGLKKADYQVFLKRKEIERGNSRELVHNGIYYLSEDRASASLFLESPIWKNMTFGTEERHPEFLKWKQFPALSFMDKKAIKAHTVEMIEKFNIICRGPEQKVRELSGGNQQKVCVSRALTFRPEILLIGEPTRGIDVYSKELILQWILKMNQEYGTTVIISSGELDELIRTCDRIAVMYQGQVFRIFEDNVELEELTFALYGRDMNEK